MSSIHFDLPWSLLVSNSAMGTDRYGQDRAPQITHSWRKLLSKSSSDVGPEKLVAKDIAAQEGVGDPALFWALAMQTAKKP